MCDNLRIKFIIGTYHVFRFITNLEHFFFVVLHWTRLKNHFPYPYNIVLTVGTSIIQLSIKLEFDINEIFISNKIV